MCRQEWQEKVYAQISTMLIRRIRVPSPACPQWPCVSRKASTTSYVRIPATGIAK
jgi:hypothetical protein